MRSCRKNYIFQVVLKKIDFIEPDENRSSSLLSEENRIIYE
jgi:hypothetical protein